LKEMNLWFLVNQIVFLIWKISIFMVLWTILMTPLSVSPLSIVDLLTLKVETLWLKWVRLNPIIVLRIEMVLTLNLKTETQLENLLNSRK